MDKYRKLHEVLRSATSVETLPLINARVTEITGESCTVMYGELELTDVRLKATISGAANKMLLIPKVGSSVLIGTLTGDLKDLAVLRVDELEKAQYQQDGLIVEIDSTSGKVKVENGSIGLKALFQELVDLLKGFKVTTPSGPSAALLPDTLASVLQFEAHLKMILK